jgi:nitrite reductase/ring-hydroxylating ferredoxin subunit
MSTTTGGPLAAAREAVARHEWDRGFELFQQFEMDSLMKSWFRERTIAEVGRKRMREPLIPMSDIPQEGTVTVSLYGRDVLVMLLDGKPRAYANVCLHHGGPLSLEGDTFVCEWHGSTFEARTGKAISGPVRPDARLMMLPTRVEDDILTYVYDE